MSMTIKAIAEASGVSAATVSRIINGTARVAPEKRAKVLAVMGERREPIRRRERTSRGINIGVLLLPEAHFDSFSMLDKLCELTDTLPRKSILTLLSPNILPQALEGSFRRGELSGMLIGGHRIESEDLRRVVERIPHVWLNSHWIEESEKNILMGNEFAGRLAARYLKKCGCRMPAVLRLASLNPGYAAQCDGFLFEYFSMKQECLCIELNFRAPRIFWKPRRRAFSSNSWSRKSWRMRTDFFPGRTTDHPLLPPTNETGCSCSPPGRLLQPHSALSLRILPTAGDS